VLVVLQLLRFCMGCALDLRHGEPASGRLHVPINYFLLLLVLHVQLQQLRSQFVELIQQEHQIEQHKAALGQLQVTYQPSLAKTNFTEVMQEHMERVQASDR